ncbi:MAG TPA: response regulator [Verrucomicrobiae bacterium]|nr:response regulator [Verrucomicrobiae bacterium]
MLIEPDKLQAWACVRALERAGHTVTHATGAQSAVQLADEHPLDLVILELQLPGHNGVEFLYEFRSYPEWLRIPIVLYTFTPPHELTYAATLQEELGVRQIIYKPSTSLEVLCLRIQKLVSVAP